jgi:hypothetical protein
MHVFLLYNQNKQQNCNVHVAHKTAEGLAEFKEACLENI